jgi:predicted hydrolase (HD superfamily)
VGRRATTSEALPVTRSPSAGLRAGVSRTRSGRPAFHDFDYEIHPTLDQHPQDGATILREGGWPEDVIRAVLSHAGHTGVSRETRLEQTLFACDELSGFVVACGYVRPDGLDTLEPRSVRKKLKQRRPPA